MQESLSLLKDVVAGLWHRRPVEFYSDEEIDWELIRNRINPQAHPPCVELAFVVKDYLVVDKGCKPEEVEFMSVQHGDTLVHLWAEYKGQVVDDPKIRDQARRGLLNIYRYGKRDIQHEKVWEILMERGFSEDLRI